VGRRGVKSGMTSAGPDRGFTLVETLVAISILAISLVVLMQLFSGGLKSSRLSDDYTRGIFHAREKMDEILLAQDLTPGAIGGEFDDGFRWKAQAVQLDIAEARDIQLPFRTFTITVDVTWDAGGGEKRFTVSAVKMVKPREGSS